MLLIGIPVYIQGIPFEKYDSIIQMSNNTNVFSLRINSTSCILDKDCPKNSWCNENKCQCRKGWLLQYDTKQCSYKQISKVFTLIISLLLGSLGVDWFFLSRKNNLYILTGLLKFLVTIAGGIWSRLATISSTETSTNAARWLGSTLNIISIIWWAIDWMRILFNWFPDGNYVPLI